jgi:hypothetical protein
VHMQDHAPHRLGAPHHHRRDDRPHHQPRAPSSA